MNWIKVITPNCLKKGLCCVYKLNFESGHFYFGSTKNLGRRIDGYRSEFRGYVPQRENIMKAVRVSSFVCVEIVEICALDERLDRETFYIQQNWGNELLLNRCPTGYSCAGLVMNEKERKGCSERAKRSAFSKHGAIYKKRVGRFDKDMNLLESYDSMQNATDKIGCSLNHLRNVVNGKYDGVFGLIVLRIDGDNNPIHPPLRQSKINPKKRGRKKGSTGTPSKFGKKTVQFDINGNEVAVFGSKADAAKSVGSTPRHFSKCLSRSKRNYYKGFIWKIAG